jgi:hypothetical protein
MKSAHRLYESPKYIRQNQNIISQWRTEGGVGVKPGGGGRRARPPPGAPLGRRTSGWLAVFVWGGGGGGRGSTKSVEDRGQREWGLGAVAP